MPFPLRRVHLVQARRGGGRSCRNRRRGAALCVAGLTAWVGSLRAASPSSGTLSSSTRAEWSGTAGLAASPDGETTCLDGTNCDVFTLKVTPGSYVGKRVRFKVTWGNPANDFDVYVHRQTLTGPAAQRAATSNPFQQNTFDLDGVVVPGTNDTFAFHVVYYAVLPPDT